MISEKSLRIFLLTDSSRSTRRTPFLYLNNKIWYFDFETSVVGTHKETGEREDRLDFEDDLLFEHAMERGMSNYQPFPFFKRELDLDYTYTQEVNYVEMQCADGDETKTMAFYNIQDFCQVLTRPEFEGSYLIAHYGQGFRFSAPLPTYVPVRFGCPRETQRPDHAWE
jgi:hypothetical protein